jgi:acetolactate synthase-1/3 small subunit
MPVRGESQSAYFLAEPSKVVESHTLSVLVDNEPGVLARVVGLFSGRGYNIESLTVSETEHEAHLSRITILTKGTPMVIEQIKNQLARLVNVHRVIDLTVAGDPLERELALIKVAGKGEKRIEALRLAEIFRASVIDASTDHFVFEMTGRSSKIEQFIAIMRDLGLVEVSRTGIAAMGRGGRGLCGVAAPRQRFGNPSRVIVRGSSLRTRRCPLPTIWRCNSWIRAGARTVVTSCMPRLRCSRCSACALPASRCSIRRRTVFGCCP